MKIILPAHNKPATQVKSWQEIKKDAEEMRAFIQTDPDAGEGKKCIALSHAQVFYEPKNFFVINKNWENGKLRKAFGNDIIINARIVAFSDPVYWPESCMSFPFRKPRQTDRMNKITTVYWVPFFGFLLKKKKKLTGIPAFIVAHENEHALGKSIYFNL